MNTLCANQKTSWFFMTLVLAFPVMGGEEQVIPLEMVPSEILATARKLLPGALFESADVETEADGLMVYEIQGTREDGRKIEVDIISNGEIEEFEVEFDLEQVPGAVLKAIDAKLPGFKPTYIEASHSASKKVLGYEFEGLFEGKKLDIEVSADGRKILLADQ